MAKRQVATEAKAASAEAKALNTTLSQIEKTFGAGSIMKLGEGSHLEVEGISTGALSLDLALGGKGLPRGRIIELFGPESSGKTTIALQAIANAQKIGGVAAFIDAEHALDPSWCKRIGVDIESLLVSQPGSAEEALQIAEMLVLSNAVDIVVVDSVAALVPKAEIEGEIGDSHVGLQARLMSQALRKLTGGVSRSKCVLVFINQIREKIGVMFGSPETTPGGRALKFYSSCRVDVRRIGPVKDGEEITGSRVKVKIVKNKVAPPFRTCEFDMMYTSGISREGDILDMALADKLVEKSGSWFNYGDMRLGQGREKVKEFLRENTALAEEIAAKVMASRTGQAAAALANGAPVDDDDDEPLDEA
ncbi:recombinase RecA [Planctomyces sp. SH-PL62]|uniref:recombinase RecA n=1 Tax=Planctomyces sp. SH-PL62 TaxID=1636152 RepID=UPI00078EAC25|nr:recombinase RecA [Planctomyces sp. SH-PL62]AMV37455.1 recombinase A [Planctomyces sp. SH-PL62]